MRNSSLLGISHVETLLVQRRGSKAGPRREGAPLPLVRKGGPERHCKMILSHKGGGLTGENSPACWVGRGEFLTGPPL